MKDIEDLNTKMNETSKLLSNNTEEMLRKRELKHDMEEDRELYKSLLSNLTEYTKLDTRSKELKKESESIESQMMDIIEAEKIIQNDTNTLSNINLVQLPPLMSDRDKLKHAIQLLQEYCAELEEYKAKYDKVETIKFYTSPTTGIQTVFMDVYMNKIISMANQLLQYLFNGDFILHPFVINENEFRIPCQGSGFINDDISSMSTSQICMISMILSFALLKHSSTKYNILKLDEIDGGLDSINRLKFIYLLHKLMETLECEQTIMISHNSELVFDNVDVIQLKTSDTSPISGNVIYKY
jgi:DNA repair exonuclease SbcCD ATPase subunit